MEIADLSWNEVISQRFIHPLLPRSIRGIIVGKSGCGKTTLLLILLLRPGWLDYDNLCVFGKSLFQPNYKQEGHDGPVSLHWLIREIHSYQTLHYLGIGLKHKTPYKD